MSTTLYTLHFNYMHIPILLIPLIAAIGLFTFHIWYPWQNKEADNPCSKKYKKFKAENILTKIISIIVFVFFIYTSAGYFVNYFDLKERYENKNYKTVSGYVKEFHALQNDGHDTENFKIKNEYFEYSNAELISGYNTPLYKGGVIKRNGQNLTIKYITNEEKSNIILEIKENIN